MSATLGSVAAPAPGPRSPPVRRRPPRRRAIVVGGSLVAGGLSGLVAGLGFCAFAPAIGPSAAGLPSHGGAAPPQEALAAAGMPAPVAFILVPARLGGATSARNPEEGQP